MNARSVYVNTHTIEETDRHGAVRIIRYKRGFNKGKRYPYRSKKRNG